MLSFFQLHHLAKRVQDDFRWLRATESILVIDDKKRNAADTQPACFLRLSLDLLAERYERRSVIITSNLVFSQWEQIFKDPMTTAAAIDRVVHHGVIVEFGKEIPSHCAQEAAQRSQQRPPEQK